MSVSGIIARTDFDRIESDALDVIKCFLERLLAEQYGKDAEFPGEPTR